MLFERNGKIELFQKMILIVEILTIFYLLTLPGKQKFIDIEKVLKEKAYKLLQMVTWVFINWFKKTS